MAVAKLAPEKTHEKFQRGAHTREEIDERLLHWSELLKQHDEGRTNCTLSRKDILGQIDRWLDESSELRGN